MTPLTELIIGYAAALLVSLLQLPQVFKTYEILLQGDETRGKSR